MPNLSLLAVIWTNYSPTSTSLPLDGVCNIVIIIILITKYLMMGSSCSYCISASFFLYRNKYGQTSWFCPLLLFLIRCGLTCWYMTLIVYNYAWRIRQNANRWRTDWRYNYATNKTQQSWLPERFWRTVGPPWSRLRRYHAAVRRLLPGGFCLVLRTTVGHESCYN